MSEPFNLTAGKPLDVTIISSWNFVTTANLLTHQPGEKAVTSNETGFAVDVDLGSARPVRQFALLYTNLTPGVDAINVLVSNNADMSSPTDFGWVQVDPTTRPAGYVHAFHHLSAPVTARYVRFAISTASPKVLEIGRLVVLNPLQLEYNPDFGSTSWGYDEADDGEILDSGVEVLVERAAAPVLNFTATWVTQAEMEAGWEELGRLQHEGVPVLVVRRPDPHAGRHNGIYYGRLRMVPVVASEFDMFEVQGRIRSML